MITALKIEQALDQFQRQQILDKFFAANPNWKGAHVSDIISHLGDSDSCIAVEERLRAQARAAGWEPPHGFGLATIALALYHAPQMPTLREVGSLLRAARLIDEVPASVFIADPR